MLIPLKLDLSRGPFRRALDIVLPLLTGGVLVIGYLALRPEFRNRLFSTYGVGYYSKIAVVLFACLVVGFVFVGVCEILAAYFLVKLTQIKTLLRKRAKQRLPGRSTVDPPWLSREWQKVAKEMLGADLAPTKIWAEERAAIDRAKAEALLVSEAQRRTTEMERIALLEAGLEENSMEWQKWYFVLKRYFNLPDEQTRELFYGYMSLHSLGWAGIVLMIVSRHVSWFPLGCCVMAIVYGIRGIWFRMLCFGYHGNDNQGLALTAAILRELHKRIPVELKESLDRDNH